MVIIYVGTNEMVLGGDFTRSFGFDVWCLRRIYLFSFKVIMVHLKWTIVWEKCCVPKLVTCVSIYLDLVHSLICIDYYKIMLVK